MGISVRVLLVLPCLAALLSPAAASAQLPTLGFRAGVSIARFAGDGLEAQDGHRTGPALGVVAGLPVGAGLFELQAELTWIRKGGEGTLQGFEEPLAVALAIDYLQLPLLARLTLPGFGALRPALLTGPAVSFELGCDVRTTASELAITLGCEPSAPEGMRRTVDWGWIAGGVLLYETGGRTFFLDARADLGLVALDRDLGALDMKNRAFVVTVGATLFGR